MKRNYQTELDAIIDSFDKKPTLLLHSCCGPCSSYVLEYLSRYFDITVLYFNPSIYPDNEYRLRLDNQKKLLELTGWARILEIGYDHDSFLDLVKGYEDQPEGGERCAICFRQRIFKTAEMASALGFEYFTTTLTVSPHKNAELINSISEQAEQLYNIKHLPSDFKKRNGYKRSVELSKELGLYRQDYCGCEFSMRGKDDYEAY